MSAVGEPAKKLPDDEFFRMQEALNTWLNANVQAQNIGGDDALDILANALFELAHNVELSKEELMDRLGKHWDTFTANWARLNGETR